MHGSRISKLVLASATAAIIGVLSAGNSLAADTVSYKIVDEGVPEALTAEAGDATRGEAVYLNRKKGNCLACHETTALKNHPFHGNVGPPMDGVASRYSAAELRLRIANPKVLNEDTIMPAFYRNDGFMRVHKNFKGKTVLSAQEVEDIIAARDKTKDAEKDLLSSTPIGHG